MTAGAGSARYSADSRACEFTVAASLLVAILIVVYALSIAHRMLPPPGGAAGPLSPAWAQFQADCEAGPTPGQGSSAESCVCWEANLQAEAIEPAYAVDALNAALVGGAQPSGAGAHAVPENLAGGPVGWAMRGCGLNGGD